MPGKKGMSRGRLEKKTARDRVWLNIRYLKEFDVPMLCRTGGANKDNVQKFVANLKAHGIARRVGPRATGLPGVYQGYRLSRDPGPSRPLICDVCGKPITAKTCKESDNG